MDPRNVKLPDRCVYPPKYSWFSRLTFPYRGIGTWFWDRTNDRLHWDEVMQKNLYELPNPVNGTLIGTYEELFNNRVHPGDKERIVSNIMFAMEHQIPFHEEFRIVLPENRIKYIGAKGHWIYKDNQEPCAMLGINWEVKPANSKLKDIELAVRTKYNSSLCDVLLSKYS